MKRVYIAINRDNEACIVESYLTPYMIRANSKYLNSKYLDCYATALYGHDTLDNTLKFGKVGIKDGGIELTFEEPILVSGYDFCMDVVLFWGFEIVKLIEAYKL